MLDNAAFHHVRSVEDTLKPGGRLAGLKLIYLPPYAPDHNSIEYVWDAARGSIANIQRDDPAKTLTAFTHYIANRTFGYNFKRLPVRIRSSDLVS